MRKYLVPALLVGLVPAAAHAEDEEILVIGKSTGYLTTSSTTATKTDTPLLDVPQTINVVTREQIEDQAFHSMADVLRYVPGTTVGQGEGNRDQITLRGQNTTADFFLDGVRDDVQYFRGLYNIERVEVLKGPYAMIFGRGGGGGIINRVQKTPIADRLLLSFGSSVNTFGAFDFQGDLNIPIAAGTALRVNSIYEDFSNHRDFVDGDRIAINPYFATDVGGWKVGLSYEYVNDDRVTDRGVPSFQNRPLEGVRDRFFGVPGINDTRLEAHIAKLRIDRDLSSNLKLATTVLYGDYDKIYTNVFPSGAFNPPTAATNPNTVPLQAYTDPTRRKNLVAQANLVWDVNTGSIGHKILGGVEYGQQKSRNERFSGTFNGTASTTFFQNFTNPVFPSVTFNVLANRRRSEVQFFSAYVQDQISIGEIIDIIAGVRYDRFEIEGLDLAGATPRPFGRTDEKVSPRVGVIVKPQPNISLYASYSRSFLPRSGDQFLTLSAVQENLAPERFTNYEIGAKWDIRPNFNVTAAVFQLDRTNATTPDPLNPTVSINVGETRTRGAELALTGRILPGWQVSGGYTYQNAKLRGNGDSRLAQVPKHQFALWNRYDFSPQFGAGVGIIHQSSQYAAIFVPTAAVPVPTVTRLPSFTRVDAALFFKPTEKVELALNVENLFDKNYFSDAHNNNNISTGAPLNARLSLRLRY